MDNKAVFMNGWKMLANALSTTQLEAMVDFVNTQHDPTDTELMEVIHTLKELHPSLCAAKRVRLGM